MFEKKREKEKHSTHFIDLETSSLMNTLRNQALWAVSSNKCQFVTCTIMKFRQSALPVLLRSLILNESRGWKKCSFLQYSKTRWGTFKKKAINSEPRDKLRFTKSAATYRGMPPFVSFLFFFIFCVCLLLLGATPKFVDPCSYSYMHVFSGRTSFFIIWSHLSFQSYLAYRSIT